jgi:hypothetical protein
MGNQVATEESTPVIQHLSCHPVVEDRPQNMRVTNRFNGDAVEVINDNIGICADSCFLIGFRSY